MSMQIYAAKVIPTPCEVENSNFNFVPNPSQSITFTPVQVLEMVPQVLPFAHPSPMVHVTAMRRQMQATPLGYRRIGCLTLS